MDKQVNLVNINGLTLNYWDGASPLNKNNNTIDGGPGIWTANGALTNDNWTGMTLSLIHISAWAGAGRRLARRAAGAALAAAQDHQAEFPDPVLGDGGVEPGRVRRSLARGAGLVAAVIVPRRAAQLASNLTVCGL